jgi:hypothetical protein
MWVNVACLVSTKSDVCKVFLFPFEFLSTRLDWIKLLFPAQVVWNMVKIKPSLDRIFGKADDVPEVNVCLQCCFTFYIAPVTKILLWSCFGLEKRASLFDTSVHTVAFGYEFCWKLCLYVTCVCNVCAPMQRENFGIISSNFTVIPITCNDFKRTSTYIYLCKAWNHIIEF